MKLSQITKFGDKNCFVIKEKNYLCKQKVNMEENKGQILLYQTPDGESRIEVRLEGETVWLNLEQMAELFQRNKSTISRHIKNVFDEGELSADSTVAFFATVRTGTKEIERFATKQIGAMSKLE